MIPTVDQLLTAEQAAETAGVKRRTFFALLASDRGPQAFVIGGRKFYLRETIEQWKNARVIVKPGRPRKQA